MKLSLPAAPSSDNSSSQQVLPTAETKLKVRIKQGETSQTIKHKMYNFIYYINGKPFSLSGIDSETTQQTLTYDTPLEAV